MPAVSAAPASGWRTFLHVLINTAVAGLTTNFLWFSVIFWVYLETRSIFAVGVLGGGYMILLSACSMWFGSLVDRFRKHRVMLVSAWSSLVAFAISTVLFFSLPATSLLNLSGPWFWIFILVLLAGCVVEMLRSLALSTTVTLLVPVERHANANGLVGSVQGLTFIVTSVFSGLAIGFLGMGLTMLLGLALTALPIAHLHWLRISEPEVVRDTTRSAIDFRGGWVAMAAVPGLVGLVVFTTLNNLSSGVYMALLDPYGLTMFSVEVWGILFGVAGTGILIGGGLVAKWGLGRNPVRTMLILVAALGIVGALFTLREWSWLFIVGIWVFMLMMPAIEAAEQTVIQRVVPYEKQGRVFGLAMTFEAAAAPITTLLVAPLAEFWVVPFMEGAEGQARWGWLLGEGESRGIALIFVWAGAITTVFALLALLTPTYRQLVRSFVAAVPSTSHERSEADQV